MPETKPSPKPPMGAAAADPLKAPPPPGADPRGRWYQRPSDGEIVWRVDGLEPVANPKPEVLERQRLEAEKKAREFHFPSPHDVEDEKGDIQAKLAAGWEWHEAPNGKKVLRKLHANPDARVQMTDAEIADAMRKGKLRFPSQEEVRANVQQAEALRRDDGKPRIAAEAGANVFMPKF